MSSTDFHNQRSAWQSFLNRFSTDSLVAPDPLTDRTLVAVIFILTFIAALTAGLVLFGSAANSPLHLMFEDCSLFRNLSSVLRFILSG